MIGKQGDPGANGKNNRLFIDAVLWIVDNKALWRDLPSEFGKWNSIYMRFRRWNECGVWRQLEQNLYDDHELMAMVRRILARCDQQTGRIKQRIARREHRLVYKSSLNKVKDHRGTLSALDESTSHWVGLVMKTSAM